MKIRLRPEEPGDYLAVEQLTKRAFETMNEAGHERTDEHYLVHIMRDDEAFVPELDTVATIREELVGNIMYTKSQILVDGGGTIETLTFGPLSVEPHYQNTGVGKNLVRHTLKKAKKMGYAAVLIFGHPDYYERFGFKAAREYGIQTAEGESPDAFLALPLEDGALDGITGTFYYAPVYDLDDAAFEAFAASFPEV